MKILIKDLLSVLLRYFLAYYAVYVLIVFVFGMLPVPLHVKDTLLDIGLPLYGILFVFIWMKRKKMNVSCITNKINISTECIKDVFAVFGINITLTWLFSFILGFFMHVEGNIDMGELLLNPVLHLVVYGLISPIDEELFFRVFLMNQLESHGKWKTALVISALFGFAHFNPLVAVSGFAASMCMFALRFKYQSILPCVFVHILINSLNLLSALTADSANLCDFILIGAAVYGFIYLLTKRHTIKSEFLDCFNR